MVEQAASALVFPIIKREDEKRVTEQAWDNPKLVVTIQVGRCSVLQTDLFGSSPTAEMLRCCNY